MNAEGDTQAPDPPEDATGNTAERVELRDGLAEVDPAAWDALTGGTEPFLRHAFLEGLERHECLGRQFGWFPQHVLIFREGQLVAAAPAYAKTNNYGEFVFDFAWEGAWNRHGLNYYPKLVVSVPYTPATGPRLLVHPEAPDFDHLRTLLVRALATRGRELNASGVNILFPNQDDLDVTRELGLAERMGCQYHWTNAPDGGYADFDAFLGALSSKKRKNIKRERRRVHEAGIVFRTLTGATGEAEDWARFHRFYVDTFEKHMGIPTLSEAFFVETAAELGDQVVLFEARRPSATDPDATEPDAKGDGETIAAALCYRSHDTLYGRFWGCTEELADLHFETCYYQGIEFCIREGLARFEPGAQGEHKIPRGFLPTPTYSAHMILTEGFEQPVRDFCEREAQMMRAQCERLHEHSPYRQAHPDDVPDR
ncbi:GNAT family N-acetyltransferase [Thioalkalivibrio sp. AKL7]|uniref:GNAT family N-acetyltransferase n=1 Tax=Thioalkalivibrio sp. AKL7 TaxID=1158155 RepID=UPI000376D984|nr:GNAT family N-acetyltransferase [Thioalkalivibrio sp. AKL7]